MRYRIEKYGAYIGIWGEEIGRYLGIQLYNLPDEVYEKLTCNPNSASLDTPSSRYVTESIRLIANETRGGYIVVSTGHKIPFISISKHQLEQYGKHIVINIAISALIEAADGDEDDLEAIQEMLQYSNPLPDQFTIEMDWGDEPGSGGGGGIEIMTDAEYTPALSDLNDMLDEIDESESASE